MGDDHRRFVEAATVDGREARAHAMLAERPELAHERLDSALVLGDAQRVGAALRDDPGLANGSRARSRAGTSTPRAH